jgi:hypothetical protein
MKEIKKEKIIIFLLNLMNKNLVLYFLIYLTIHFMTIEFWIVVEGIVQKKIIIGNSYH